MEDLLGKRIHLDANAVVYFGEGHPQFGPPVEQLLSSSSLLQVLPIDRSILIASATLRAGHGGKLPDAIHVATAAAARCDILVGEDQRIRPPAGIKAVRLSELKVVG